jgi:hypothetical protein
MELEFKTACTPLVIIYLYLTVEVRPLHNVECKLLCVKQYDEEDVDDFIRMIDEEYRVNMYLAE